MVPMPDPRFGSDEDVRNIPRTMSTQHPDNARNPPWCRGEVIEGDAEVYEAYFAYSELGCQEVMWDSEGKDADTRVVRKLLSAHDAFFKEKVLGRDIFLTYRIPNPRIEVAERKVLMETLLNIPVGYDVASAFYKRDQAPIFEVILPFTASSEELLWLSNYYEKGIAEVGNLRLDGEMTIEEWLGPIRPDRIEVIPLLEDDKSMIKSDKLIEPYIEAHRSGYYRVFLARSDPALNYGLSSAVILCKLALSRLRRLEERKGIKICPIVGVGSLPFRGHLSPANIEAFLEEYRGVYTVTVQSALKYDYPLQESKAVIERLNRQLPHREAELVEAHEEDLLISVFEKFKFAYQKATENLAPIINGVAKFIPKRRSRKLHIGLYGYSRRVGDISLPRAIPFTGALYSLGIPPELLGSEALGDLNEEEYDVLLKFHMNLKSDLEAAAGYLSWHNLEILGEMYEEVARRVGMEKDRLRMVLSGVIETLQGLERNLGIKIGSRTLLHRQHENTINNLLIAYLGGDEEMVSRYVVEAASIRRTLG